MTVFKLLQTLAFTDFLIQCSETSKAKAITQALNEVLADHPELDLTSYNGYVPESIGHAIYNVPHSHS